MMSPLLSQDVLVIIFDILPDIRACACVCRGWYSVALKHPDHKIWKKLGGLKDIRNHVLRYGSTKMIPLITHPIQPHDILLAASCGNMIMAKYILANNQFNHIDEALIVASSRDSLEMVKYLAKYRNTCGSVFNHALAIASEFGHLDVVKCLIAVSTSYVSCDCAFVVAVSQQHINIVKYFIEIRPSICMNNDVTLQIASKMGRVDMVELLIKHGADPTLDGNAALMNACDGGHADIVKILIDKTADVSARNNLAIKIASEKGFLDIVKLLLAASPDTNKTYSRALVKAIAYDHHNIMDYLFDYTK
jgi:ankyrin repeat protein